MARVQALTLSIAPGGKAELEVAARVPARARPGDHHALVLLATRPSHVGGVGVRMRLGVRVSVRVPGKIVRRVVSAGPRTCAAAAAPATWTSRSRTWAT